MEVKVRAGEGVEAGGTSGHTATATNVRGHVTIWAHDSTGAENGEAGGSTLRC